MSIYRSRFGAYIKETRGLSIRWLQARTGVALTKLSMLCNDSETRVWFHEAIALASALGISLDELSQLLPQCRTAAAEAARSVEAELLKKLYGSKD
jgi:hypothetical protein